MSSVKVGQLDLSGIDVAKSLRKPRTKVKKFQIQAAPEKTEVGCNITGKCMFAICTILIIIVASLSMYSSSTSFSSTASIDVNNAAVRKKMSTGLRRIIRMKCVTDKSTHCSTDYENGEYVVNVANCPDVYEFNGIPFTELYKDKQNNYHVPSSQDMNLVINDACKDVTATYDTNIRYLPSYATKSHNDGNLKKVVWITKKCYKDFTLKISEHVILDKTPAQMIDHKKLINYVAYEYQINGDVSGSVSVKGNGCNIPIHVYTLRE